MSLRSNILCQKLLCKNSIIIEVINKKTGEYLEINSIKKELETNQNKK
jgi:hypothetical protein